MPARRPIDILSLTAHSLRPAIPVPPPHTCQWPSGDRPFSFECNGVPAPGKPYCAAHMALSFYPRGSWKP